MHGRCSRRFLTWRFPRDGGLRHAGMVNWSRPASRGADRNGCLRNRKRSRRADLCKIHVEASPARRPANSGTGLKRQVAAVYRRSRRQARLVEIFIVQGCGWTPQLESGTRGRQVEPHLGFHLRARTGRPALARRRCGRCGGRGGGSGNGRCVPATRRGFDRSGRLRLRLRLEAVDHHPRILQRLRVEAGRQVVALLLQLLVAFAGGEKANQR